MERPSRLQARDGGRLVLVTLERKTRPSFSVGDYDAGADPFSKLMNGPMSDVETARDSWWPYVLPIVAFLVLVEIAGRVDAAYSLAMLIARVAIPAAIVAWFWSQRSYPEWKIRFGVMTGLDLVVGVSLAVVWAAPFIAFPSMRPDLSTAFDPSMAGVGWTTTVLAVRMLGFAVVTPVIEELFMRSLVVRYADVFDSETQESFRSVPIAKFTVRSFWVVVIVFLATHAVWQWPVMFVWAALTNFWFYYRKDLMAVMVVHAATNASLLLAAIFLSDRFSDGAGGVLPLWFLA